MTRAQKCIDCLYGILKGVQTEKNPCIVDHYTMIKGCDPEDVEFVIKEAINLLNKYDPDWVKEIRGMEG
jgi:hypothetical protein